MIWLLFWLVYVAIALPLSVRFARVIYRSDGGDSKEDLWMSSFFGLLLASFWPVTLTLFLITRAVRRVAFDSDTIEGAKRR